VLFLFGGEIICEHGNLKNIPIRELTLPLKKYARRDWILDRGGIPVDSCLYEKVLELIKLG